MRARNDNGVPGRMENDAQDLGSIMMLVAPATTSRSATIMRIDYFLQPVPSVTYWPQV